MKKLPTKLEKQTVLDAISEIIFEEAIDIEVLFSDVYTILKAEDWSFDKLAVMDIPENIRGNDTSFAKNPHYRFTKNERNIFIGPKVMAFTYNGTEAYKGWSKYKEGLTHFLELSNNVFKNIKVSNISLNFIDFFKDIDIFEKITITIDTDTLNRLYKDITPGRKYVTGFGVEDVSILISIEESMSLGVEDSKDEVLGSILDIKITKKIDIEDKLKDFEKMHTHSKNIFFNLLQEDFIKSLGPIY